MMPVSGWLIGKVGSRKVIVFSSLIMTSALPALLSVDSTAWTALALFVFGAGLGSVDIAINAHGVQIQHLYGNPIMSSLHGFYSVGGLFGPLIIILLLKLQLTPLASLSIIAMAMTLLAISQQRFLMTDRREKETVARFDTKNKNEQTARFSWIDKRVFFLGALCFIVFLAEGAVLDWSAIYLRDAKHVEENLAGLGYAAFSIAMAFMRLVGDRMISKYPVKWMVVLGSLITALGFLIVILTPWLFTVLVGFILVGLGAANIIPVFFSEGAQLKGIPSASSLAAVTTLGYVGQLAGPAMLGLIAELSSLSMAFGCTAMLMAVVSVAYLLKSKQAPATNEH